MGFETQNGYAIGQSLKIPLITPLIIKKSVYPYALFMPDLFSKYTSTGISPVIKVDFTSRQAF